MASGSGAGARAAACPTRKERLELRKQRYVDLRRAMWSARVRLDQDKGWSRLLLAATLGRKKKEEEKEREEKETEDMMSEDRSACGRAFGDVLGGLKLKNECSIGVDASTSGSDLEMKEKKKRRETHAWQKKS